MNLIFFHGRSMSALDQRKQYEVIGIHRHKLNAHIHITDKSKNGNNTPSPIFNGCPNPWFLQFSSLIIVFSFLAKLTIELVSIYHILSTVTILLGIVNISSFKWAI